jgi:hypothetical protein
VAINRLNPDYPDAGMVQLLPSSVTVGSGSSTVNGNGQVSFSGSSSVSLNGVFSSTYLRYLVMVNVTSATNNDRSIFLKLRNAGTDTSTYYNSFIAAGTRSGTTSNLAQFDDTNGYKLGEIDGPETGNNFAAAVHLIGPFVNDRSQMHIQTSFVDTGGNFRYGAGGGNRTAGGSHDSLNLISSAGTITGTVSVYGYRN